jgi:hypothetical protein
VLEGTEGNIVEAKRRGVVPEACFEDSAGIEARGMCGVGRRGTWEIPSLGGETEPPSKRERARRGVGKSECRIRAEKWGNQPEGPCGAKSGTGTWNRMRERWTRRRTRHPSQRNSNG